MSLNLILLDDIKSQKRLLDYLRQKALKLRDDAFLMEHDDYGTLFIKLASLEKRLEPDKDEFRLFSLSAFCGNVDKPQPVVSKLCARHLKSELLRILETF